MDFYRRNLMVWLESTYVINDMLVNISFSYFCLITGRKAVEELINTTWEIEHAPQVLERSKKERMTLMEEAGDQQCKCNPEGAWLKMAEDVLANNYIDQGIFCKAVSQLLREGRGKHRNILLTGPANCGKTFLLGPVTEIFQCFQNPAASSFAWLGAEESEIILLNDFRWSQKVIEYKAFFKRMVNL